MEDCCFRQGPRESSMRRCHLKDVKGLATWILGVEGNGAFQVKGRAGTKTLNESISIDAEK